MNKEEKKKKERREASSANLQKHRKRLAGTEQSLVTRQQRRDDASSDPDTAGKVRRKIYHTRRGPLAPRAWCCCSCKLFSRGVARSKGPRQLPALGSWREICGSEIFGYSAMTCSDGWRRHGLGGKFAEMLQSCDLVQEVTPSQGKETISSDKVQCVSDVLDTLSIGLGCGTSNSATTPGAVRRPVVSAAVPVAVASSVVIVS